MTHKNDALRYGLFGLFLADMGIVFGFLFHPSLQVCYSDKILIGGGIMGVVIREKVPGSGEWWVFINHKGNRRSKYVGSRSDAEKVASAINEKIQADQYFSEAGSPSFGQYSGVWLENYIKPLRKASTRERYETILRKYVIPEIGKKPIDQVKRKDIRDLLLKIHGAGASSATLSLVRDVLSGVMGYAVDDELIKANPVTGVLKRLKLEREKQIKVVPMTGEEVNLFLSACERLHPEHYVFFLTAFRTGMRLGELIGLHWSDVDWNKKNILVQRSFRRLVVSTTKTGKNRLVDMLDQLIDALRRLETIRKKEALQSGAGEVQDIIFHRNGTYLDQKYIRRIFKRILKKAGMRDQKPHIMRHTYASLLLSNKESPVYVKEQLGHSSIEITVDIYGHLIPGSNREAVNSLDNQQKTAPERTQEKGLEYL